MVANCPFGSRRFPGEAGQPVLRWQRKPGQDRDLSEGTVGACVPRDSECCCHLHGDRSVGWLTLCTVASSVTVPISTAGSQVMAVTATSVALGGWDIWEHG